MATDRLLSQHSKGINMRLFLGWAPIAILLAPQICAAQQFDEEATLGKLDSMRRQNTVAIGDGHWVQPSNKNQPCLIYFGGDLAPLSTKWFGECADGKANGIGIAAGKLDKDASIIALEEYSGPEIDNIVTYRQIIARPGSTLFQSGTFTWSTQIAVNEEFTQTPQGNKTVNLIRYECSGGECVTQTLDPLTGSVTYIVQGTSGYQLIWSDVRAKNTSLFNRRALIFNGKIHADSIFIDGELTESGADSAGNGVLTNFSFPMSSQLNSPFEKYVIASDLIDAAAATANEKYTTIKAKYCGKGKTTDPDLLTLYRWSSTPPSALTLAAAEMELNAMNETLASDNRSRIANAKMQTVKRQQQAQYAQQQQMIQAQLATQAAQIAELKRQNDRQALLQGLQSLNQVGQQIQQNSQQMINQSGMYQPPQVQQPTLSGPTIVHCRTIGYITYCN